MSNHALWLRKKRIYNQRLELARNAALMNSHSVAMAYYTLNPFMAPDDALTLPEWYVWVAGSDPVGPVSVNQIARGIREGRLPDDACIARSGDKHWEEVLDSEAVISALKWL